LKWARKDIGLRRNFFTEPILAWALYLNGQFAEAEQVMNHALSSGVREAELFFQAATISRAASGNGDQYLQLAAEVNPRYESFHMHH